MLPEQSVKYYEPEDRVYTACKAFILFLQGVFKSRSPGNMRWDPDPQLTEIEISMTEPDDVSANGSKPFIMVSRGPATYTSVSRDQTMSTTYAGDQFVLTDLVGTTIVLTCAAKEGVQAGEIAYLLFRLIPAFRKELVRAGRLHAIHPNISMGMESALGSMSQNSRFPSWKMLQVLVPVSIQESIERNEGFHNLLQNVNISMSLDG